MRLKILFPLVLIRLCLLSNPVFGATADSTRHSTRALFFYPILYYTPETKLAGGGTINYVYRPRGSSSSSRPSSIMPLFIYTQKKQTIITLAADLYWRSETLHLYTNLQYINYPDTFFGIGNRSTEESEEHFTSRRPAALVDLRWRFHPGLYVGIQYEIMHATLTKVEEDGLLVQGDIPGTETGLTSGIGFRLHLDTRDNVFSPSSGRFCQAATSFFTESLGSDHSFTRYTLDLREYITLLPDYVLAVQAYLQANTGEPPFYLMPLFGGSSIMRGYYAGRYRDRNMAAFQVEFRAPVWWRLGLVGFAGMGDVSRNIDDFRIKDFKYSLGFGLRFMISPEEKINFRLDFGFGKESSGIYMGIIEAF